MTQLQRRIKKNEIKLNVKKKLPHKKKNRILTGRSGRVAHTQKKGGRGISSFCLTAPYYSLIYLMENKRSTVNSLGEEFVFRPTLLHT